MSSLKRYLDKLRLKINKKQRLAAFILKIEERRKDWRGSESYFDQLVYKYVHAYELTKNEEKLASEYLEVLQKVNPIKFSNYDGT